MAVTYLEISYPNFVLGAIIDPEEANQNNHEIVTKINDNIILTNSNEVKVTDLYNVKADKTLLTSTVNELAGVGRTTETVKQNATNLINHKISTDHDYRYYIKSEIDSKINTINFNNNNVFTALVNHKTSNDHDTRYYTKDELVPWLRGGDTIIREEVFVIVNSNNGDGTFTYSYNGTNVISPLDEFGGQTFTLRTGNYAVGDNRLEVIINDTLRRSVASGGIRELSPTSFVLTSPEGNTAEVTVRYFERIGMVAEYNIKLSDVKPPANRGKNMWFKIIGVV